MGSRQFALGYASIKQRGSRDVKHGVVGSVNRVVHIALTQVDLRAHQSTLAFLD